MFHKDFFKLQLEFARILETKHNYSFEQILFKFTSLYVRCLGFSDTNPPTEINPEWIAIINSLTTTLELQTDYFYKKYLEYESSKPKTADHVLFGCFSYSFHQKTNQYELHFDPIDPKGNLGKDRVQIRKSELKDMFEAIKKENKQNATFFVRTWLLNIEAFNRLFPEEFINSKRLWETETAQDNSHWGQFVDRFGNVKTEIAKKLLENAKTKTHDQINLYFPLPTLKAEIDVRIFFNFY